MASLAASRLGNRPPGSVLPIPSDRLQRYAFPQKSGVPHQGRVFRINRTALKSRNVWLLCTQRRRDLILAEALSLTLGGELAD
jgi:hypothetical protein